MAVAPLFVADLDTLKGKLRLANIEAADAASPIIDESVRAVRVQMYSRLGIARVGVLLGYASTDNPTDEEGLLRALAETTETNMVRLKLICTLPILFRDQSGDAYESWNEDGLSRERPGWSLEKEKQRLEVVIEEALQLLSGEESLGEVSEIQVFDGSPLADDAPKVLGHTLERNIEITSLIDRFDHRETGAD